MQITRISTLLRIAVIAAAAATAASAQAAGEPGGTPSPAHRIQSVSGAYLAAKTAQLEGDLSAATDYFAQALALDPTSELLQQDAMFAFLADGRFEDGVRMAAKLPASSEAAKVARIALGVDALRKGRFDAAIEEFDILDPSDLDALLLVHLSAWADLGAGRVDEALARIAELDGASWYPVFNDYQSGLVSAVAGRPDAARDFYKKVLADQGNAQTSPDAYLSSAEALARLEAREGNKAAALAAIDQGLEVAASYDPLVRLRERIEKGETIEPMLSNVREGAAETLYVLGQAINRGDGQQVALLYFQLARALAPSNPALLTALAGIAERSEKLELAISYYQQIPADSAYRRTAELQMGLDLWYAERKDEAKEHLRGLVEEFPNDVQSYIALADVLAADKDYAGAAEALDKAIAIAEPGEQSNWNLYYQRGIAHERLKQWDKAEPDFRKALELFPNQPQVLNYLGYSWVDMNRNLEEGLEMIRTAVDLRPNDGYIIDSLGWAYFRLGRFEDAVEQLERAVLINPGDPTINDHLGDAYWRVGRTREARFQWERALAGEPKPEVEDVKRIQAKLEDGLPPLEEKAAQPAKADAGSIVGDSGQAVRNSAANRSAPSGEETPKTD